MVKIKVEVFSAFKGDANKKERPIISCNRSLQKQGLITCGRRPAGLLVTRVVVVVVGGNFYTWAFQRAHVWFLKK